MKRNDNLSSSKLIEEPALLRKEATIFSDGKQYMIKIPTEVARCMGLTREKDKNIVNKMRFIIDAKTQNYKFEIVHKNRKNKKVKKNVTPLRKASA